MEKGEIIINSYISLLYRQSQRYYNRRFNLEAIGRGQYYFLLRIQENEGISVLDLASLGCFDKGTTAKAIQRLKELGYITVSQDKKDRRIHRLYTTENAKEVIASVYEARQTWENTLKQDMTAEESACVEKILKKMADSAARYLEELGDEEK